VRLLSAAVLHVWGEIIRGMGTIIKTIQFYTPLGAYDKIPGAGVFSMCGFIRIRIYRPPEFWHQEILSQLYSNHGIILGLT
jgi:hypothetical protein